MRLVFLDSGPLGLLANARGKPRPDECRTWVKSLAKSGVRIFVPEIADYEIRRKLLHIGSTNGIRRLDQVKATLEYVPLNTDVMLRAAELWAMARRIGLTTAPPEAIDGDCILAAQALMAAGPNDSVTVATENVRHLGRLVNAAHWEPITGTSTDV